MPTTLSRLRKQSCRKKVTIFLQANCRQKERQQTQRTISCMCAQFSASRACGMLRKMSSNFVKLTMRRWAYNYLTVKLLLVLASTVILGSESHETHDHILLSQGFGSLQLAPTPPPPQMTRILQSRRQEAAATERQVDRISNFPHTPHHRI
jgi:hypothetical protein